MLGTVLRSGSQAFSPTMERSEETHVPKGFDPEQYCKVCVTMASDITELLYPQLRASLDKRAAKLASGRQYASQGFVGELDDLAYEYFEANGCRLMHIYNDRKLLKPCVHMADNHMDEIVVIVSRWAQGASAGDGSVLASLLCSSATLPPSPMRACTPDQLEFTMPVKPDDKRAHKARLQKEGKREGGYVTERPPPFQLGPVHVVVGETLFPTINDHLQQDLMLYFYWPLADWHPRYDESRHRHIWPRFNRVAELLHALPKFPTAALRFAKIDAARNELPPPWDVVDQDTLACFHAGRQRIELGGKTDEVAERQGATQTSVGGMTGFEWVDNQLSLGEVLESLATTFKNKHARNHVANLMLHLGDDRLLGAQGQGNWWEDDEILARARAPYVPSRSL